MLAVAAFSKFTDSSLHILEVAEAFSLEVESLWACVVVQGTLTPLNPTKALAALKHKWEHHFDKQVS